ncbi:MAG TPA: kelch repeat-containing protein [Kofleriaceae bacterium]
MGVGSFGRIAAAALALAGCLKAPPDSGGDDPGDPDASALPRTWVNRDGDNLPPPLFGPHLTYDSSNGQVLSYGGSTTTDNSGAQSILMAWDGSEWSTLCDDCPPGARVFHGFTFDTRRGVAVLYGGIDELGQLHDDLWEWDGDAWTTLAPGGDPPGGRSHFWMAYDEGRARVVLFGGNTGAAETNEIFEYDGAEWYPIGVVAGPTPRSEQGGPAAYDPISGRVLVYGSGVMDDDLWAWDGGQWSRLCQVCTGVPRSGAMLEVDPARERILIVGGYDPEVQVAGTWELLPDGTPSCASAQPSQRDTAGMARDAARDVIVLYGGNGTGCGANCSETLELTVSETGDCVPR